MTTIRVGSRDRWTSIARATLNDSRLSFKARGVLVWLLDKPDDWATTAERIETQGTEGREAIRSALKELESFHYLQRRKWKSGDGVWRTEWIIHENPGGDHLREPVGGPTRDYDKSPVGTTYGFPSDGNPSLLLKTEEPNTEEKKSYPQGADSVSRLPGSRPYCEACDGWTDGQGPDELACRCSVVSPVVSPPRLVSLSKPRSPSNRPGSG